MKNMTYHTKISFIKSLVRMIGYGVLIESIAIGAVLLIVAELLGIMEEM